MSCVHVDEDALQWMLNCIDREGFVELELSNNTIGGRAVSAIIGSGQCTLVTNSYRYVFTYNRGEGRFMEQIVKMTMEPTKQLVLIRLLFARRTLQRLQKHLKTVPEQWRECRQQLIAAKVFCSATGVGQAFEYLRVSTQAIGLAQSAIDPDRDNEDIHLAVNERIDDALKVIEAWLVSEIIEETYFG